MVEVLVYFEIAAQIAPMATFRIVLPPSRLLLHELIEVFIILQVDMAFFQPLAGEINPSVWFHPRREKGVTGVAPECPNFPQISQR
jgi:hypothetical protein